MNCILRKLPLQRLPLYILAQISGAFCAAAVVYGNYIGLINAYEGYGIRTVAPSPTATAALPTRARCQAASPASRTSFSTP